MIYTIIDCYTDEPSGLGVPPYLGTFPRYIYGALKQQGHKPYYLTIDDVRLWKRFDSKAPDKSKEKKTNTKIKNIFFPDIFVDHDTPENQYKKIGMDSNSIEKKIFSFFKEEGINLDKLLASS